MVRRVTAVVPTPPTVRKRVLPARVTGSVPGRRLFARPFPTFGYTRRGTPEGEPSVVAPTRRQADRGNTRSGCPRRRTRRTRGGRRESRSPGEVGRTVAGNSTGRVPTRRWRSSCIPASPADSRPPPCRRDRPQARPHPVPHPDPPPHPPPRRARSRANPRSPSPPTTQSSSPPDAAPHPPPVHGSVAARGARRNSLWNDWGCERSGTRRRNSPMLSPGEVTIVQWGSRRSVLDAVDDGGQEVVVVPRLRSLRAPLG